MVELLLRSWAFALHYVLFENAMSVVKLGAMISGLLELSDAHEWVVTTKLGNWMKEQTGTKIVSVRHSSPATHKEKTKSFMPTCVPSPSVFACSLYIWCFKI